MLRKPTVCTAGSPLHPTTCHRFVMAKSGGAHAAISVLCKVVYLRRPRVQCIVGNCRCHGEQRTGRRGGVLHVCWLSSRLRCEGWRSAEAPTRRACCSPRCHGESNQP